MDSYFLQAKTMCFIVSFKLANRSKLLLAMVVYKLEGFLEFVTCSCVFDLILLLNGGRCGVRFCFKKFGFRDSLF